MPLSKREHERLAKLLRAQGQDDPDAYIDSSITYHENLSNLGIDDADASAPSRAQQKELARRGYQSAVEQAIGKQFEGFLENEQAIRVLPLAMKGRGVDITIQAPILVDSEVIKAAVLEGLEKVGEAIASDVSNVRAEAFADHPGAWSFPSSAYQTGGEYYGSGMVPYWSGGLIGSFKVIGPSTRMSIDLGFTAPYAGLIEKGGDAGGSPPDAWYDQKGVPKTAKVVKITPHPFTGAVAYKLQEHLEDFGYLDVFAIAFKNKLMG